VSLWQTIRSTLGLAVATPDPPAAPALALSIGAESRLASLSAGEGALVTLQAAPAGWLTCVAEGPLPASGPHPAFSGQPVAIADPDLRRLDGLVLDHDGERWRVLAELRLRARETPNPDGRTYLLDRALVDGRAFFPKDAARPPWLVRQLLHRDDVRSVLLRDMTITVERDPGAPWTAIDAAVGAAVREHVLSAGGPISPQTADAPDGALALAIADVLEREIAPVIHRDGGDVELVDVRGGVVRVRLTGACRSCPASMLTLKGTIERALKVAFPGEVDVVESVPV
jgi:Fe-S cluster biogenesis protein NfuA